MGWLGHRQKRSKKKMGPTRRQLRLRWRAVVGKQRRLRDPPLERTGRIRECFRVCAGHSPPIVSTAVGACLR